MARFPYLGTDTRIYPHYLDAGTGRTLTAEPGEAYEMAPVAAYPDGPVPPSDSQWGPAADGESPIDISERERPAKSRKAVGE